MKEEINIPVAYAMVDLGVWHPAIVTNYKNHPQEWDEALVIFDVENPPTGEPLQKILAAFDAKDRFTDTDWDKNS